MMEKTPEKQKKPEKQILISYSHAKLGDLFSFCPA
jgi:hypothetical protein